MVPHATCFLAVFEEAGVPDEVELALGVVKEGKIKNSNVFGLDLLSGNSNHEGGEFTCAEGGHGVWEGIAAKPDLRVDAMRAQRFFEFSLDVSGLEVHC